ncbi:MAG: YggS family pyridoxal phosphate-dependent enzyme [Betaproteobacteria bacterium]|nr:YggS family pyridoxal phosphate-dependent enzyme [Betaproteobacteria bacterium]
MTPIYSNLQAVRERIFAASLDARRAPESVGLLAVSKTWPASAVCEAVAAGQRCFGENYIQEAVRKQDELAAMPGMTIEWHFIGPIQGNKTRLVAERFDWAHSLDRFRIAERLARQRPPELPPLNVCIEVNIDGEADKHGCRPDELAALAQEIARLPRLRLRGLMCIPAPVSGQEAQRAPFRRLRELKEALCAGGLPLDTLSMGMSHDLEAAIAEGATLVRVGTAIFGERARNAAPEASFKEDET